MVWSYGASDTLSVAEKVGVYHDQINMVQAGSHGGSYVIHGSVAIILLCVGYVLH